MNMIVVDDEKPVLLQIESAIRQAVPDGMLTGFISTREALAYAKDTRIDVAFLDIDMGEMNGLSLAKKLKDIYGKTNIIFVTAYSEYALDAFSVKASGYILKPADPQIIIRELDNLRNPPVSGENSRVRIQCFGNFSLFVDGKPLVITREKPRELLAYLVHKRGTFVSTSEISAVLWEDQVGGSSAKTNMRQVVFRLMQLLKEAGIKDIILKKWDMMAINRDKVSCDYYDFIDQKTSGINAYTGEYLSEYSWAEFAINFLNDSVHRENKK